MNVVSLELCKELYTLSKWEPQDCAVYALLGDSRIFQFVRNPEPNVMSMDYYIPAYDLGYLLRKLPANIHIQQRSEYDRIIGWRAVWHSVPKGLEVNEGKSITELKPEHLQASADTPEDAACKLAIELFQQGILKSE